MIVQSMTELAPVKLDLTLNEVIERLPSVPAAFDAVALDAYLQALYALGRQRHIPNISPQNVALLQQLLRERRPQRILEIGCANGYSTLRLWQAARDWDAHITTMDISHPSWLEAQQHFTAWHTEIELHFGNALAILPTLPAGFDFILIDAQKIHTLDFYLRARKLAAPDALMVVDDVLKFKHKMQNFYDYLHQHGIGYEVLNLADDDDGVMIIG